MNDATPPPIIPNQTSTNPPTPPYSSSSARPLGENPEEQIPISGIFSAIEAILRQPRRVMFQLRQQKSAQIISALLLVAFVSSLIYGFVAGTFSGGDQLWAAPLKIAVGLFISAFICLPSLYIFSCLSGSQARVIEVLGLVAGLLALMTVLLIGFAPVAWVFSQSTNSVAAMGALHLVFLFIALFFGLRFLQNGFAHLSSVSDGGFKIWVVIFLLVLLQMTTALRPIIGKSDTLLPTEKKFFLAHWAECLK